MHSSLTFLLKIFDTDSPEFSHALPPADVEDGTVVAVVDNVVAPLIVADHSVYAHKFKIVLQSNIFIPSSEVKTLKDCCSFFFFFF